MARAKTSARNEKVAELDMSELVGGIATDAGQLVHQQMDLLRAEVKEELGQAGRGAAEVAVGGGLMAAAGLIGGLALVHLLHGSTRLPLWACHGLVAGGIGAAALKLLMAGKNDLADIQLTPPPETTAGLQENLQWLKNPLNAENPEVSTS